MLMNFYHRRPASNVKQLYLPPPDHFISSVRSDASFSLIVNPLAVTVRALCLDHLLLPLSLDEVQTTSMVPPPDASNLYPNSIYPARTFAFDAGSRHSCRRPAKKLFPWINDCFQSKRSPSHQYRMFWVVDHAMDWAVVLQTLAVPTRSNLWT